MAKPVRVAFTAFDGTDIKETALQIAIIKKKVGSANELARLAAPKGAQMLYNALRVGPRLILRSAFELLKANMVTRVLSVVVLLLIDKFSLIRGRISVKQFVINVTLALMLLVGGTAGWMMGSHVFSLIMESLILGIIAGIVGAGILSAALSFLVNRVIHLFTTDDTEDMLEIFSQNFVRLAEEYLLNYNEIEAAKASIGMCKQLVNDLFVAEDRDVFATDTMEPHIKKQYNLRKAAMQIQSLQDYLIGAP